MGKSWFSVVKKVFSPQPKEKKDKLQKPQKSMRRWLCIQKSKGSVKFPEVPKETTSIIPPPPSPRATTPSLPPPPPSPPPPPPRPSPPPPTLPPAITPPPSIENVRSNETEEPNRHALVIATAVAAEAAVVAAQAAAQVVRLTAAARMNGKSREEIAAIKIQTAFRGYMARRALHALRGLVRLKSLVQGQYAKKQATATLRCMQTLARVQSQIHERRIRMSEENKARHRLLQQKREKKEPKKSTASIGEEWDIGEGWDVSTKSKEQIQASLLHRKEAAVRRERALAYAYSHQRTWRNSSKLPHQELMDPNNPHWGWSWLERWMASRPWEVQAKTPSNNNADHNSVKTSNGSDPTHNNTNNKPSSTPRKPSTRQKTHKATSHGAVHCPTGDDPRNVQSERYNRRRSVSLSSTVRDDESVSSSSSVKSYLGPKQAAKSKATLSRTSNVGEKKQVVSAKKRVAISGTPATTRRLSTDTSSSKDSHGRTGERSSKGGNRQEAERLDI